MQTPCQKGKLVSNIPKEQEIAQIISPLIQKITCKRFKSKYLRRFFETLSVQLCCRRKCKFVGCRFAFGADIGKAKCCDWNVGVVGSRNETADHDFFFASELAVWLYAASVNADVAETAASLFVAAGMERDTVIVAFPPEGRTVRDVTVVGGEGCVNGGEGEREFLFCVTSDLD